MSKAKEEAALPATTTQGELVALADYQFLQMENIADVMAENVGNDTLTQFDLDVVKVPTGGYTSWEVQNLDGESESVKEISGIIVHWTQQRTFYRSEFSGDNSPPDCRSDDCVRGVGDPGGSCLICPYAQFGSDLKGGPGQACDLNRLLFIVQPDSMLPIVVKIPPASVSAIKKFFTRLTSRNLPFYGVEIGLRLQQVTNKGGIKYSQVQPVIKRILDENARKATEAYTNGIRAAFTKVKEAS